MTIGSKYKWKYQSEVLTYLGVGTGGSRGWHQFEKVDEPGRVWCEVLDADLHMLEETRALNPSPLMRLCGLHEDSAALAAAAAGKEKA